MLLTLCPVHLYMSVWYQRKGCKEVSKVCVQWFSLVMTTRPEEASEGDKRNPV